MKRRRCYLEELLSDKYEVIQELGRSGHSQVLLVKHKELEVYRAAKVISKKSQNAAKLLQEANLMKNLQHSGIPLIYDMEEDNNSICIIEEYISGKSLRQFVETHTSLDIDRICYFFIALCDILAYLHSYGNEGIIHLDLKPDNIIIDENEKLWLIDFDNALRDNQGKEDCEGTIYFAAPEQYHRLKPDKQADIYSFGMLLMYVVNDGNVQSGIESLQEHILYPIIKKCVHHQGMRRYHTVFQVKHALIEVQNAYNKEKHHSSEHSIVMEVRGARRGIGATHLCLSMAAYLAKEGHEVLCMDQTPQQHMAKLAMQGRCNPNGTYTYGGISVLPNYGPEIQCENLTAQVYIIDMSRKKSASWKDAWRCMGKVPENVKVLSLIVTDGKYGGQEEQQLLEHVEKLADRNAENHAGGKVVVFANHMSGADFYQYAAHMRKTIPCYAMPCMYHWNAAGELFSQTMREFLQDMAPEIDNNHKRSWMEAVQIEGARLYRKCKDYFHIRT